MRAPHHSDNGKEHIALLRPQITAPEERRFARAYSTTPTGARRLHVRTTGGARGMCVCVIMRCTYDVGYTREYIGRCSRRAVFGSTFRHHDRRPWASTSTARARCRPFGIFEWFGDPRAGTLWVGRERGKYARYRVICKAAAAAAAAERLGVHAECI